MPNELWIKCRVIFYQYKNDQIFLIEGYRLRSTRPTSSHGRQHIINFGKIELKIYQGDITAVGVDVLVYSSNTECDLSRGLLNHLIIINLYHLFMYLIRSKYLIIWI